MFSVDPYTRQSLSGFESYFFKGLLCWVALYPVKGNGWLALYVSDAVVTHAGYGYNVTDTV